MTQVLADTKAQSTDLAGDLYQPLTDIALGKQLNKLGLEAFYHSMDLIMEDDTLLSATPNAEHYMVGLYDIALHNWAGMLTAKAKILLYELVKEQLSKSKAQILDDVFACGISEYQDLYEFLHIADAWGVRIVLNWEGDFKTIVSKIYPTSDKKAVAHLKWVCKNLGNDEPESLKEYSEMVR